MDPVTLISIFAAIAGVVFGISTFLRNRKKDDSEDGRESGAILTELGYIKSGVDDLKRKQEKADEQNRDILRGLTAVEESAKQAHKRIDVLEGRINNK